MLSNNNHIDSPMRKTELRISHLDNIQPGDHIIRYLDQDFYDLMQNHDLNTIYIARKDEDEYNIYLGDQLLEHRVLDISDPKYLIGLNENKEWVIYMQAFDTFTNGIRLEEVCRFNNPDDAIAKLYQYNHVGDHTDESLKIYLALSSYIQKEIGINECIIHIISMMGYRDDPRLQNLNARSMAYGVKIGDRDITLLMRQDLRVDRINSKEMTNLYADLYNVFVLYNFFTDKMYTEPAEDEIDLAEPIKRVLAIFNKGTSSNTSCNCQ